MDYIELNCTVSPRQPFSEILIMLLAEKGFDSFVETELGFQAYIPAADFSNDLLNQLELNEKPETLDFKTTFIKAVNWNAEWESSFQPIDVNGVCLIRAPFHSAEKKYRHEIIIEPKMSFGTGHHETTFLMVSEMLQMKFENNSVLDMGCGTGILAILASRSGAESVEAIDIDEWSYLNTKENLITNKISNVNVHKGDVKILADKKFHVILANINKNVLLADMDSYYNCLEANGQLLMSGFFETDIPDLERKAKALSLALIQRVTKNNWSLLHFEKK